MPPRARKAIGSKAPKPPSSFATPLAGRPSKFRRREEEEQEEYSEQEEAETPPPPYGAQTCTIAPRPFDYSVLGYAAQEDAALFGVTPKQALQELRRLIEMKVSQTQRGRS
jgi:hypothetical protein